ncbi:PH domain-containing protein [Candidatus Micrarchaeota archaeon]|nr:PH domain-containing protein [Candidatus Micrarchaeota archaeon]
MSLLKIKPTPKVQFIQILLSAVILTLLVHFLRSFLGTLTGMLYIGIWVLAVLLGAVAFVVHYFKEIEVEEDHMAVRTGVINSSHVWINYSNVTNVTVRKNLLERIMGVGTLEVDTSGTNKVEVIMSDLNSKDLEDVMKLLKEKSKVKVSE